MLALFVFTVCVLFNQLEFTFQDDIYVTNRITNSIDMLTTHILLFDHLSKEMEDSLSRKTMERVDVLQEMDFGCHVLVVYLREGFHDVFVVETCEYTVKLCFDSGLAFDSFQKGHFTECSTLFNCKVLLNKELTVPIFICLVSNGEAVLTEII